MNRDVLTWAQAKASKNCTALKASLKQHALPTKINQKVQVKLANQTLKLTPLDMVLTTLRVEDIGLADRLIQSGATLPKQNKQLKHFKNIEGYIQYLLNHPRDLYIAAITQTNLDALRDRYDNSLAHLLIAFVRDAKDIEAARLVLKLVLRAIQNFNFQNLLGDSPIHSLFKFSGNKTVQDILMSPMLSHAHSLQYDFHSLNRDGYAPFHLLFMQKISPGKALIQMVLSHIPQLEMNLFSSDGKTAVYYAIKNLYLNDACFILEQGADLTNYSGLDSNPMNCIDEHLKTYQALLNHHQYQKMNGSIQEGIKILDQFKTLIQNRFLNFTESMPQQLPLFKYRTTSDMPSELPPMLDEPTIQPPPLPPEP